MTIEVRSAEEPPRIPVRLERGEDLEPYAFWAAVDSREISRRVASGFVDRDAPGFGDIPEGGPEDKRPLGWPSTLSAAEALRSAIADLRWWGLIPNASHTEVVSGLELLEENDGTPAPVPKHPDSVTGRAFLAANAGAGALDALDPTELWHGPWHERVDPELLDQELSSRDVLALAYGDPHLRPAGSARVRGMHPAELYADKDQREMAAECLNLYWRREVEARRRGEGDPEPPYRYEATVRVTIPLRADLGDPWKTPEERVDNLITALLSDAAVERFDFESRPQPLPDGDDGRTHGFRRKRGDSSATEGFEDPEDVPF